MDKTLGQVALDAIVGQVSWAPFTWKMLNDTQKSDWERIASAVAAAVKEEDARICEEWGHECHGEGRDDSEAFDCADRIRASIKEGK